jgi:hypothetical protein
MKNFDWKILPNQKKLKKMNYYSPFHLFDSFNIKNEKMKIQEVEFISLKNFDHSEPVLNLMDYGDGEKKKFILREILKIMQ